MEGDRSKEFIDAALSAVAGLPIRVDFNEDPYKPSFVELESIKATDPQQNVGSEAMRILTELADEYQVGVKLHVEPFGEEPIPIRKLKKFYRRFGFRDRDLNWMVRLPTKVKNAMSKLPEYVRYGGALYAKGAPASEQEPVADAAPQRIAHTIHYKGKRYELVESAGDGVDDHAAEDLFLSIANEGRLYDVHMDIYRELYKQQQQGTYNPNVAMDAFLPLVDAGARIYMKDVVRAPVPFDYSVKFNNATVQAAAIKLRDLFELRSSSGDLPGLLGLEA